MILKRTKLVDRISLNGSVELIAYYDAKGREIVLFTEYFLHTFDLKELKESTLIKKRRNTIIYFPDQKIACGALDIYIDSKFKRGLYTPSLKTKVFTLLMIKANIFEIFCLINKEKLLVTINR